MQNIKEIYFETTKNSIDLQSYSKSTKVNLIHKTALQTNLNCLQLLHTENNLGTQKIDSILFRLGNKDFQ